MEVCEFCHEEFDPEELIEFGGRQMCADCLDSQTITCDRCGARIWRNGNAGDSDTYLCDSCFENYYTNCSHCGALIREEDAHYEDEDTPLCYDCYRQRMNRYTIQPYGFKPDTALYYFVPLDTP